MPPMKPVNTTVNETSQRQMTKTEWQLRCDLAGLYRICDYLEWTDLTATHLSVRVPGESNCFLINNYGELFSEITASSLVKVDVCGTVHSGNGKVNPAGFAIHGGVYKARPDVNCVMHTHTRPGTGVAVLEDGLRPISQDALEVYDELAYHDFGQPTEEAEGRALGESCQHGDSIVLRNHGLLTVGATLAAAFYRMYMLNRACEIEIIARSMGSDLARIKAGVIAEYGRRVKERRAKPEFGEPDFRAALRQVQGRGTDWRQ